MDWRIGQGGGLAIYFIGVEDDGTLLGLNKEEMQISLSTLCYLANHLKYKVDVIISKMHLGY